MAKEAYKDHRAGSSKGAVHKVFDEKGKDAALKKAVALGLSENTARTWCSTWAAGGGKASKGKAPKKAPAKAGKKAPKKSPSRKRPAAEQAAAAA